MKTFYFSLIVFLFLIIVITVNSTYIHIRSDELIELTMKLSSPESSDCSAELQKLEELWGDCETLFSFSVLMSDANYVSDAIISLRAYCNKNDETEFERQKLLLVDKLEEIKLLESFSLESVF